MSDHPSPFLTSNRFQRIFHTWVSNLLQLGLKRPIEIDDIYDILPDDKSQLWTDLLEKAWNHEIELANSSTKKKYKPSLFLATWKVYGRRYLIIGVFLFLYTICRFAQPFVLVRLIRYFAPCSTVSTNEAIILAILTSLFPWVMFLLRNMAFTRAFLGGMHLRCAYSGLIFRKIIKLSMGSLGEQSSGKIVNLITNDVQTIDHLTIDGHFLWIGVLETIVILIILWSRVGTTILLAIFFTGCVIILQVVCGKCIQSIWTARVRKTDLRIKLMNEIIKSIHLVKMYAWEIPFQSKVERVRKQETFYIICQSIVNTVKIVNGLAFPLMFFLIIFGLLWYRRAPFDTEFFTIAFVLTSYLRHTYLHNFSAACINLYQYWVASERIEKFLMCHEYDRSYAVTCDSDHEHIQVKNLSATWPNNAMFELNNISFSASVGNLIMVIGSVASGKSSLLMALLGEMSIKSGKFSFMKNARLSYVSQEPWIFSGTIKENILFGLDYNEEKFYRCIHATALNIDLENLPYGDSTLVGDNGIVLSGGQKARVSLARALYRDNDIYLLDDPLSAVDAEVGRHIFEKCILGRLHSKVCILATHQIQYLKYATTVIFLERGHQIAAGTYMELLKICPAFEKWTQTTSSQLLKKSSSTNESSTQLDLNLNSKADYQNQLSLSPGNAEDNEGEILLRPIAKKPVQQEEAETKRIGSIGRKTFMRYIRAGGCGLFGLSGLFLMFTVTSIMILLANWWLGRWSNSERIRYGFTNLTMSCSSSEQSFIHNLTDDEWHNLRSKYFYILLGFTILSVLLLFLRTISYFISCHITARSLHNQMFHALLHAPVHFFDSNPVGRIVNRFSKDVLSIDEQLSDVTYNFVDVFFHISSIVIFIAIIQPLTLIGLSVVFLIMERTRRMFSPSQRDIKRLESLSRSPIYSHLSASIEGVLTIRSYQAQSMCIGKFAHCLNENNRICSIMLAVNRWAAMKIECVVAAFIGFLTCSILFIHRNLPISDISLMLAYSFTLVGSVQWIMRLTVDVMMQMTSAERVIEYTDIQPEESVNVKNLQVPSGQWPMGKIVFENVSFRYSSTSPWVLKNLNFSIQIHEKIGIVGRTGAGKSSIIQSLFRMAELEGRILIDNIDTKQISLYDLRRKISIIPQNPVLFNDTLRINIDPFGEYSDSEIWNALHEVQLKSDMIHSLKQQVTEGGSNFSVGQRQLICLARALLRKTKILVIDEATANVDHRTDELIQSAIRRKFQYCTVLTIAHRLRTIIDSDKVLVLSDGQIIEFERPYDLLCNERSFFTQLVSQTGGHEASHLIQQAKIAALTRQS